MGKMDFTIRKAEKCDADDISKLFVEMLCTIHGTTDEQGYDKGYLDKYFLGTGDLIFIAESEDRIIGFLSVEVHNDPQDYIYLDDFSVTERYRDLGIGTALLRKAEDYASNIGMPVILLHVEKTNTQAFGLYHRLGFHKFRDDGTRILLAKDL